MEEADAMDTLPCSAGHTACYISPYDFLDIWRHPPELNEVRSIMVCRAPLRCGGNLDLTRQTNGRGRRVAELAEGPQMALDRFADVPFCLLKSLACRDA